MPMFVTLQGKLLLFAIKESSQPTELEIEEMIKNSTLPNADLKFEIHSFSFGELRTFYSELCKQTNGPKIETLPIGTIISNALLSIAGSEMQKNGLINLSCSLFPISSTHPSMGLYLVEILNSPTLQAPPEKKKRWKLW